MKKYLMVLLLIFGSPGNCTITKIQCNNFDLYYDEFEISEHSYLHFIQGWLGNTSVCVIHDPDCPKCKIKDSIDSLVEDLKNAFPPSDESEAIHSLGEDLKHSLALIRLEMQKNNKKKDKKKDK